MSIAQKCLLTACFNTLKLKAHPTDLFFATMYQLLTTAERAVIKILSFRMVQTAKQYSAVVESLKDLLNI